MTLKNRILLTIGTLITLTALTIIYVASKAIYKSDIAHAYSVLSINNENIYTDIRSKISIIKNYSISALYNKQSNLNVVSPREDVRLKFVNNIVIKDVTGKDIISFPNDVKGPCANKNIDGETTFFYKPSIGSNSLCIAYPTRVDNKSYTSIVNISLSFFNKKLLSAPAIITDAENLEISLTGKTISLYEKNLVNSIVDNPDIIKEQASFIKTNKHFVLLQDAPKTNIKIISYNELGVISSSYNQFIISSLGTMLLILLASMIIFYILVNSFLKPIRNLCTASKCFADGEYDHKIETTNFKEINELISSFNIMIKKIKEREKELNSLNDNLEKEVDKKSNELVHAAKMASLGTLSSGIAHEFNNILGAVIGHVSLALEKKDPKEMESALEIALMASERACGIVSRLQDFAKNKGENFSKVNVNDAINNVLILIQKGFINNNIKIKTILQPDMTIMGDQPQIEQVILNLLINSKQAMPKGGLIEVDTKIENANVIVLVKDTGKEIDEELKARIFEPFFTTKGVVGMGKEYGAQDIEGTGLGLSVSHGIIDNHGGTIKLLESSENGTTFEIKIPVAK
jgi:signal transduction histidine kinase